MTSTVSPEIVAAAVAGTLSFLSPCMIPVVPAFLARIVLSGAGRLAGPLHRAAGVVLIALGVLVVTQRIDLLGTVVYTQAFQP